MRKNCLSKKQPIRRLHGHLGRSLLGLFLCLCVLVSATTFALQVIALAHPEFDTESIAAEAEEGAALCDASESGVLMMRKASDLAATAAGEYVARLTDRSNDIGVCSEGYTDSPYNYLKNVSSGSDVDFDNLTEETDKKTGGTFVLQAGSRTTTLSDQFWDGKKPFRITAAGGNEGYELQFAYRSTKDFCLEDDVSPNAPLKIDNLSLNLPTGLTTLSEKNFYARGNKLVIGENVTTQSNKTWRIYGGADYAQSLTSGVPGDVLTNVVVAGGHWDDVFGGGRGSTGRGTQVTIRDDANVDNIYGGGEYMCTIGDQEKDADDDRINIYVEDGAVGNLWGGSRVNSYSIDVLKGRRGLPINRDININVSGGTVGRLVAGSDCTDSSTNTNDNLSESTISGSATVNITGGSVGSAVGDPNRKSASNRQIQGVTTLNVSSSNNFSHVDLFDVVKITGDGVVVSTASKIGESFTDGNLTFWGGETREGYVGRISVTDGAKLVLNKGGTINKEKNSGTGFWIGESEESDRSLSTLAIKGGSTGANITAATSESFNDTSNTCGLRVHGEVQGYSTLEVTDDPIYSTGDDYYYYVVADSSANGGKAFREPAGADYIVCYRYLDGGAKIGWYLRERPSISIANTLVRAGDTSNIETVMSVNMNSFGYEWNSAEAQNTVDFTINKTAGTDGAALSVESGSISLASIAGIKTDASGRFRHVVTNTADGVEYLVSFDYVIDDSAPVDPIYYSVDANCHVVRDSGSYDDVHTARTADAARCVYDFAGNDSLHADGGYADSIMTTFPYSDSPAGADTALLRVYLPYSVSGALAIAEDDNQFRFTTDFSVDAQLDASGTVPTDYASADAAIANSHFGVTIGGSDLSSGVSKTLSSAVSEYTCAVYSYKNLSTYDISQLSPEGLQLELTASGLTKSGSAVGSGDPSAVNNGELQIQTAGTYQITYHFVTRTQGAKMFVVKGLLGEAQIDEDGYLTDAFVLSKAPYESNYGENLIWNAANIVCSGANGVLSAELAATQSAKQVSLNYRLTEDGAYDHHTMVNIGANRENSDAVAAISVDDPNFKYWEIRKSASATAPVYARCYDAAFSYCVMDDYWIAPVFGKSSGDRTARLNPDALKNCDEKWLAWTYGDGVEGHLVSPSEDLTFNGLSDKVIFVRVPKDAADLGSDWSNVWNRTVELSTDGYDGKTFVLTSLSETPGDNTMYGYWSDTITLTQTEYTRNRWTDSEGNLSANGRSDYLYSDFEIAYSDSASKQIYQNTNYRTGVVFELCGSLGAGESFAPDTYRYRSDETNLKTAILNRSSSYNADGSSRRIQCNDISTSDLTKKNRVELGKSYYNTNTNANAIMKVTAYLVDSSNSVTLSNSVYICLKETSQMDLAISVGG